nr:gametogenetin-like [Aegilops tauschii subsp. strangulata]
MSHHAAQQRRRSPVVPSALTAFRSSDVCADPRPPAGLHEASPLPPGSPPPSAIAAPTQPRTALVEPAVALVHATRGPGPRLLRRAPPLPLATPIPALRPASPRPPLPCRAPPPLLC